MFLLANGTLTTSSAAYLYYSENLNKIYLRNGANTGWLSGTLDAVGPLQNERVVLDLAGTSVQKVGDTLTRAVSLSFTDAFLGTKKVWLRATDGGGLNSGWVQKGTMTVVTP